MTLQERCPVLQFADLGDERGKLVVMMDTRLSERSCLHICEIRPSQSGRTTLPSTRPALRDLRTLYIST